MTAAAAAEYLVTQTEDGGQVQDSAAAGLHHRNLNRFIDAEQSEISGSSKADTSVTASFLGFRKKKKTS